MPTADKLNVVTTVDVGAGAFYMLVSAKVQRKKSAKKAKTQSTKEKSAISCFFLPPTLETQFQSQKLHCRGKRKGFE
jgi:hypothetical protein